MIAFPNAKINIGLDILRRRPDGYHDISTVMVPVDWHDILEIVPSVADGDTLTVTGRPVDCPVEKNLVMKALRVLREVAEVPPVDIFLRKIIPDGAGLGGGSSDAAFTLTTLDALFSLGLGSERLAQVAGQIGADCPFFVYNRPMLCEGTGNVMTPVSLPAPPAGLPVLLVKPDVGVSTAEAYAGVTPRVPAVPLGEKITSLPFDRWQGEVKNDFEPSVFSRLPLLGLLKQALLETGAEYASMSGSGSTVYGIFPHRDQADRAEEILRSFRALAGAEFHISTIS